MAFRFIHTADIHLDSPLKSLAMRNAALSEVVANATRQVLVRIVDLCLSEQVDALLIAGDLYDGDQTSMKTARFLASQLRRLDEANIAVFIIRGNHDAESKITRELTLPDCVHVFGSKAEAIEFQPPRSDRTDPDSSLATHPIVIHGASFRKPHAPDSLLPLYQPPRSDAINIGMMHTSLDGAAGHDLYAPCSLADLQNHGFDYWALGHIHKRAQYADSGCCIVMPGIPQGRDIGEAGDKSVTLVNINADHQIDAEEHKLAIAQFEEVSVPLDDISQWADAIDEAMSKVDQQSDACNAEHLVARVFLTGNTTLAWRLQRDADLFEQELTSRFEDNGHHWLDKLIVDCQPLQSTSQTTTTDLTPQTELHELMLNEINHSDAFRKNAKQSVDDFLRALPGELRSAFGDDETALAATIETLAHQGSKLVTAKLHTESSLDDSISQQTDEPASD